MIVTPALALRVAILGGIALVLFAIIFFRLWYLQVLSGDRYLAEANDNRVRQVKVEAPRGEIVDRNGTVLVDNRTALAVQVMPDELPDDAARRNRETRRLAAVLETRPGTLRKEDRSRHQAAAVQPRHAQDRRLARHGLLSPGEPDPLPGGRGRAHLPAQVPAQDDRRASVRNARRGDREAAEGVALQRRPARRPRRPVGDRIRVRPLPARAKRRLAHSGRRARAPEGRALGPRSAAAASSCGSRSTTACRRWARTRSRASASQAAFVAMDPRSGEVLGLGSNPSFDPNVFAKGIPAGRLQAPAGSEQRRAARRPGDPGPLSDGIDLQADHRDRRAPVGPAHAFDGSVRRRVAERRRDLVQERGRCDLRRARAAARASGLLRRVLLSRRAHGRPARRRHHPEVGAPSRHRSSDRNRPPR